jgi:two-component system response regulator AtoC
MKEISKTYTILVVDDEENMRHMLEATLSRQGYRVKTAANGTAGLRVLDAEQVDVVLCDLKMPVMDGLTFLGKAKEGNFTSPIIMMSAFATIDTAVQAMKDGAYDFITKPFKTDEVSCVLAKAVERLHLLQENEALRAKIEDLEVDGGKRQIVGSSKPILELKQLIRRVAKHETTVLVTGESGTGKELVARGIHRLSDRSTTPFVSVNCGAIPDNLLESEFFGYVKGAFSGAEKDRNGLFHEADGGVLFLDEIGELPLPLQVKFLRVLQERAIRPVGATTEKKVDVRIIAATAKNLQEEVAKGRFRQDLFYRLHVVCLHVPPLRDRKDDLVALCDHFLKRLAMRAGDPLKKLSPEVIDKLLAYDWPGNVRELENCIERAVVLSGDDTLDIGTVASLLHIDDKEFDASYSGLSLKDGKVQMESSLIRRALVKTSGNKSRAAELLEISYPSLLSKIKEYGLG